MTVLKISGTNKYITYVINYGNEVEALETTTDIMEAKQYDIESYETELEVNCIASFVHEEYKTLLEIIAIK